MTKAIKYYFVLAGTREFGDKLQVDGFPIELGKWYCRRYKCDSPEGKTILKLIRKEVAR